MELGQPPPEHLPGKVPGYLSLTTGHRLRVQKKSCKSCVRLESAVHCSTKRCTSSRQVRLSPKSYRREALPPLTKLTSAMRRIFPCCSTAVKPNSDRLIFSSTTIPTVCLKHSIQRKSPRRDS